VARAPALLVAVCAVLAWPPVAGARVQVPEGVRLERFASGIPNPANLAFDRRRRLWVTSAGHLAAAADGVWMVPRRGARPRHVIRGLFSALGLVWHRGELYVSHVVPYATFAPRHTGRVVAYSRFDGRRFRRRRVVVAGLPVGRHRVDSLAAGRDGRLYLGIGSESDNRPSSRRLSGTVVSFRPRGGSVLVEARGLRNPYGLAFLPGGRRLLVSEHGRDDLGPGRPPDELDVVDPRGPVRWYGFPQCWHQGGAACRGARAPLAFLRAHSAPGAVAVAARFGRWGPSAFVPRFGSSFEANASGGDVVRVPLRGRARVERFASGFGIQEPLGAAIGPDGGLYVSLWDSGRIVRLVPEPHTGAAGAGRLAGPAAAAIALRETVAWLGRALGIA
jgi:glucose/arabinose dehydrogenase